MKRLLFVVLTLVLVSMMFWSCDVMDQVSSDEDSVENVLDSRGVRSWDMWDSLNYFNSGVWNKADWSNGGFFNCGWKPDHAYFQNGRLVIKLDNQYSHGKPYTSGEYRTNDTYTYGYFETNMKAVARRGTVTSFFLYTGNPWDEIDFEILGKDPWKVQLNYFVNGVGGHEKIIDLGFDSSKGFHKYGIEYGNGYINWYIDGRWVYGVNNTGFNAPYGAQMPSHPMQIMVNHWPGVGEDGWLGYYNYYGPTYAEYDYITYRRNR